MVLFTIRLFLNHLNRLSCAFWLVYLVCVALWWFTCLLPFLLLLSNTYKCSLISNAMWYVKTWKMQGFFYFSEAFGSRVAIGVWRESDIKFWIIKSQTSPHIQITNSIKNIFKKIPKQEHWVLCLVKIISWKNQLQI